MRVPPHRLHRRHLNLGRRDKCAHHIAVRVGNPIVVVVLCQERFLLLGVGEFLGVRKPLGHRLPVLLPLFLERVLPLCQLVDTRGQVECLKGAQPEVIRDI